MDAALAGLIGAGIGAVAGLGGAWITGRTQRRLARDSRRHDAYVAVLTWLNEAIDFQLRRAIGGYPQGVTIDDAYDVLGKASRARALLAAVGSAKARSQMDVVVSKMSAWVRLSSPGPATTPEAKQELKAAWAEMRDALIALQNQVNSELA